MAGFVVHYGFPGFTSLQQTRADILILANDATYRPGFGGTILTPAEKSQLAADGKEILGYVNLGLTDHLRGYWNDCWVSYSDSSDRDTGPVNPGAPTWLSGGFGLISELPSNQGVNLGFDGHIVDFREAAWRQIVIDQAVATVSNGHTGVFLDDVGLYFAAGYANDPANFDRSLADAMMDLVVAVSQAVKAVNPAAKVVVNNGVNLIFDGSVGGGPKWEAFVSAIDGMLVESAGLPVVPGQQDVLADMAARLPGVSLMSLEYPNGSLNIDSWLERAGGLGFAATYARSVGLQELPQTVLMGTSADDQLTMLDGGDIAAGLDGNDRIFGAVGDDMIFGHSGFDALSGGRGDDSIYGGTADDTVYGGSHDDLISGGDGNDSLAGDGSSDTIHGGAGNDVIDGGTSADTLYGDAGSDSILGGSNADWIEGGTGQDTIRGGTSADTVYGGSHADRIYGDSGDDSLFGDGSSDTIFGGSGDDHIDGGGSADVLYGGSNRDTLFGGSNNDTLYGGAGSDTVTGGTGKDAFAFSTAIGVSVDVITDFSVADDMIWLEDHVFAGLATGALVAAAFAANATGTATTASHRILYETDTGRLYFDEDGTGSAARIQFAALDPGLALTAADFLVF